MESVLAHLRKLITLTENGEEDQLVKLVNMAVEVSNQIVRIENGELVNRSDDDAEEEPGDDADDSDDCEEDEV